MLKVWLAYSDWSLGMWWHWGHKGGWWWPMGPAFFFMFWGLKWLSSLGVAAILALMLILIVVPLSVRLWQEVDRVNRERTAEQDKLKNGKPKNDADYRHPTESGDWFEERREII